MAIEGRHAYGGVWPVDPMPPDRDWAWLPEVGEICPQPPKTTHSKDNTMKASVRSKFGILSTALLGGALSLALAQPAEAAVFAKYDGIDGESKDDKHDKWIDVLSIDWGAHKPGGGATGQSRRRGGVIVEDLTMTLEYDKAAPKLQEALHSGEAIPTIEIDFTAGGQPGSSGQVYLKLELKEAIVTSYDLGAVGEGAVGIRVDLSFSEVKWTYVARDGEVQEGGVKKQGFFGLFSSSTDEPRAGR